MKKGKKTVFVGMSGGVDSSVAALLLKRQGYDVLGVFMRAYNVDGCAERDAEDARRAAEHIGIPFYVWDTEAEYKKRVVNYMIEGYRAGLTPNPDVACNREIKFGIFLDRAKRMGADYVATGHYVKIGKKKLEKNKKEEYTLSAAKDPNKDQSYFLWTLTQKDLAHCLFPLGELEKPEVREIAKKAGLPTAEKKDSQGICFLGQVTMADFLKMYMPEKEGAVVNLSGEKVGTHQGAHFYTIGQRQGIGNIKHEKGNKIHKPVYVVRKDVKENTVVVAEGADNEALYRKEIGLVNVNLINPSLIRTNGGIVGGEGVEVLARVRYRQPVSKAVLALGKNGEGKLEFASPQKFVAEGQSAVFYLPAQAGDAKNMIMLGGGIIA